MIIARSDYPVEMELCTKIAQFCDVQETVILVTSNLLYQIPLILEDMHVAEIFTQPLGFGSETSARFRGMALDGERTRAGKT